MQEYKSWAAMEMTAEMNYITAEVLKRAVNTDILFKQIIDTYRKSNIQSDELSDDDIKSLTQNFDISRIYKKIKYILKDETKIQKVNDIKMDVKRIIYSDIDIQKFIIESQKKIDQLQKITKENIEINGGDEGTIMRTIVKTFLGGDFRMLYKRKIINDAYTELCNSGYVVLHNFIYAMGGAVFFDGVGAITLVQTSSGLKLIDDLSEKEQDQFSNVSFEFNKQKGEMEHIKNLKTYKLNEILQRRDSLKNEIKEKGDKMSKKLYDIVVTSMHHYINMTTNVPIIDYDFGLVVLINKNNSTFHYTHPQNLSINNLFNTLLASESLISDKLALEECANIHKYVSEYDEGNIIQNLLTSLNFCYDISIQTNESELREYVNNIKENVQKNINIVINTNKQLLDEIKSLFEKYFYAAQEYNILKTELNIYKPKNPKDTNEQQKLDKINRTGFTQYEEYLKHLHNKLKQFDQNSSEYKRIMDEIHTVNQFISSDDPNLLKKSKSLTINIESRKNKYNTLLRIDQFVRSYIEGKNYQNQKDKIKNSNSNDQNKESKNDELPKKRILFIPIKIFTLNEKIEGVEAGHANIIMIDLLKKKIEHYEPHGVSGYYDKESIKTVLDNMFKKRRESSILKTFTFESIRDISLTYDNKGGQKYSSYGYCLAWCVYISFLRILNLNLNLTEIEAMSKSEQVLFDDEQDVDVDVDEYDKIKKLERKYKLLDACESKNRLEDFMLILSRIGNIKKKSNDSSYTHIMNVVETIRNSELKWDMRSDVRSVLLPNVQSGGSQLKIKNYKIIE